MNAKGEQNEQKQFDLTLLGGYKGVFTLNEPVNVSNWYKEAEAEIAEFEAKERPEEKTNKDVPFKYPVSVIADDGKKEQIPEKDDWVIGVRPEFVSICEDGPVEGEVFSAMPTGMETTVRIRVGNFLLTSVVFGGITYKIGEKIRLNFTGKGATLFSRVNGRLVGTGTLEIE